MAGSIVELVREQRGLYEELLALAGHQGELARRGDGAGLEEVLARRGVILARLGALQDAADARGGIDACVAREERGSGMGAISSEVSEHRARVLAIGAELARRDGEDVRALREASRAIGDEIDRVGSGRRAMGAYGGARAASGSGVARFQDRSA